MDNIHDTLREFRQKVDEAIENGEDWVETSPEVVRHFNKKGMNGAKFFTYGTPGVKVCEFGMKDVILKEEEELEDARTNF